MRLIEHHKYKWSVRSTEVLAVLVTTLLYSVLAFGQKPEYDFYTEFRNSFTPKLRAENPSLLLTNEEIVEKYAAKLKSEGVTETEIARRTRLIRTERSLLEADYWNRFYTNSNANFNKAPNGFLVQMVEGRRPGAALDYGMGEGRNAIYLASLGWQVWGFDPADAGVALAQKRAKELGLTLHTDAVRDSESPRQNVSMSPSFPSGPALPPKTPLDLNTARHSQELLPGIAILPHGEPLGGRHVLLLDAASSCARSAAK